MSRERPEVEEQPAKQRRLNTKIFDVYDKIPEVVPAGTKLICTHSGSFHCDEALAIAMLSLTKDFENSIVVRTRDEPTIAKADIVVDVGAVYNPETLRFDHHQKSFQGTLSEKYKTRLSSAGLIYKHFGLEIVKKILGPEYEKWTQKIYDMTYVNFIEHIDGIDNGVEVSDGKLNYRITTTLSSRVGALNPSWTVPASQRNESARFKQAMALTGGEFYDFVSYYAEDWIPARAIVDETVEKRFEVDPSGEIITFQKFCPWKEHLFEYEKEHNIVGQVKIALFQDTNGTWRIQSVPVEGFSFSNRCPLPEAWRGIRDEELSKLSGIPGCIFAHASGFIGGNKTYEGVLQMARESLKVLKAQNTSQ